MRKTDTAIRVAVAAMLAATAGAADGQGSSEPKQPSTEKCYGVVKAGKNDCSGPHHSCRNMAKRDNDPLEYINVPHGMCERLAGGSLAPKPR